MYPYVLWRLTNEGWKRVRSVGTNKIAHCSTYEKVLPIGVNP